MRKLLIGLLILGGAIAAIAVISRRRAGSGVDEWDSFASKAAGKATDAVKDAAATATKAAKDAATTATKAAKHA